MSAFMPAFSWTHYSKKLSAKIEKPRCAGFFTKEEATARGMRLAIGESGSLSEGNFIRFHWLVDGSDGIVVDAKFQVFGQSALIGAAEGACLLAVGKTYEQVRRISADLIDKQLRDGIDEPAFPPETRGHLNLCIDALEEAALSCQDIPLQEVHSPVPQDQTGDGGHPDFPTFTKAQKLALIEEILTTEIRPYIELDAGGVDVLDLSPSHELTIAYKGACTSCYSSIGTTLSTIQQILQAKIHESITVVPNLDDLKLS